MKPELKVIVPVVHCTRPDCRHAWVPRPVGSLKEMKKLDDGRMLIEVTTCPRCRSTELERGWPDREREPNYP